ncbi:MAG: hypothetical protein U0354_02865 [Candidatus Sericytochromatia bacterium]
MNVDRLIDFLKEVPLLCNLEDDELRQLAEVAIVKDLIKIRSYFMSKIKEQIYI